MAIDLDPLSKVYFNLNQAIRVGTRLYIPSMSPVADHGFLMKHKQGIISRGRRKCVGPPGLLPVDPSDSLAAGPKLIDLLKERIA